MNDSFTRPVLILSLLLHIGTAFLSEGYHHYDEHYQILEWASFKLGFTPIESLSWEFPAQMRSWMQPGIAYLFSKVLMSFGVWNPFWVATLLRLLSALLGWYLIVRFVKLTDKWFPDLWIRRVAIFLVGLAWFVPYIHARFSSENWGGLFFFLGFIPWIEKVMHKQDPSGWKGFGWAAFTGVLWGLAFQFRFQSAVLIVAAVAWIVVFTQVRWVLWAGLAAGFILVQAAAFEVDYWGYGTVVWPAWNYFVQNVIEGKANEWGRSPVWDYFIKYFIMAPPLSSLLVMGVVAGWFVARKFSLTWITAFFVLVHSLIAHKEMRFLFPVVPVTPLVAAMLFQKSPALYAFLFRLNSKMLIALGLIFNALFMLPLVALPARTEIAAMRAIWKENPGTLYFVGINPYAVPGVGGYFYRPNPLNVIPLPTSQEKPLQGPYHLACSQDCQDLKSRLACVDQGGSMPLGLSERISESLRRATKLVEWRILRCP